jgi:steroid 5-alpha reductase family enzyme
MTSAPWTDALLAQGGSWLGPAIVTLAVSIVVFALLWRLSLRLVDCSVVDLYWGFGFGVIAWLLVVQSGQRSAPALLLAGLVTLWSLRLGLHLWRRHRAAKAEDPRYADMRRRYGEAWPKLSFWLVFMLQALVMWLIALPLHVSLGTTHPQGEASTGLVVLGTLLFSAGFVLEAVADAALAAFRKDPGNAGRLLTTGVFGWSRHPNYFGETMLWWGFGLIGLAISGNPVALVGPAILTLLLVKVSGIPPLEAHLGVRPGFADYAARTSAFVPMPPRGLAGTPRPVGEDGQA